MAMAVMIGLLMGATLLVAGFNILVKLSGGAVPETATTPVLANLCLSSCALAVQLVYLGVSAATGASMRLRRAAYLYAAAGGVCVGAADVAYFYLFSGIGGARPMAASVATPTVVAGAVVLTMAFSFVVLKEALRWTQMLGGALIVGGIVVLFLDVGGK